jgi:prepilin-type N-terminal cleavage/methylation domain-containing protein
VREFYPARRRVYPRRGAGLTLIELVIVVCIIGILAAVVLNRLRFYQEAAEKAAMEHTLGALKSALQLRVAALLLRGEERNIKSLAGANPFGWLAEAPNSYRGEFVAAQPVVPSGSWYFDSARKEIVYVPDLDDHLERLADGSKRLRFRVRLDFELSEGGPGRKQITEMRIEPVSPYVWFYKP